MTGRDVRMTTGVERGRAVTIVVDGRALAAHEGESIAAALVASASGVALATRSGHDAESRTGGVGGEMMGAQHKEPPP